MGELMPLVHKHLIIRAEVAEPPFCEEKTKQWLKDLVEKINMKILSGPHCKYLDKEGNRGLTGVCIIETSHIAIHVWDECSPALIQLDVYTCSELTIKSVFEHLECYKPVKVEYKFLDRETNLELIDQAILEQ